MIAVIILTFNEAHHIARAIASVASFASEVVVVDSGSTDDTRRIAEAAGARTLVHPFINQAQQFNWALDNVPLDADWILRLDADEIIEPDLARALAEQIPALPSDVTGVILNRKHIFMGRWIRHGGRYPLPMLRIFRRGAARSEDRWMDEHLVLTTGRAVTIEGGFADHNLGDLSYFTDKHRAYATREAVEVLNQKLGLFDRGETRAGLAASHAVAAKRGIKEQLYNRLPFGVGPVGYFLYRYIFQLGFLDGREGAIYHGLQGLWYRFLVEARLFELERQLGASTGQEALDKLSELTGLKFVTIEPAA
ncbi:MAG: glycosyltransferase family 2 protein [Pseudomonadota bacterium]